MSNTPNYASLSKAELIKLLQERTETPAASEAKPSEDLSLVAELAAALATRRNADVIPTGVAAPDLTTYEVENLRGTTVILQVADTITHQPRVMELDRKGAKARLTRRQIEELQERSPHFFSEGFLSNPIEPTNPNAVGDLQKFIADLDIDDVEARVQEISSKDTLFDLYNHIESKRFITTMADGQPITVPDGKGGRIAAVREAPLPPKEMTLLHAVQRRIHALSQIAVRDAKSTGGARMTGTDLFEEIRTLLREPQVQTSANPWQYQDADLIPQVRAALRRLKASGLAVSVTMSLTGVFSADPSDVEGMAIAYFVASALLSGDLVQKLKDGELGVMFRAGADVIDTKGAAALFNDAAAGYRREYEKYLTMAIAAADGGTAYFGEQTAYPA